MITIVSKRAMRGPTLLPIIPISTLTASPARAVEPPAIELAVGEPPVLDPPVLATVAEADWLTSEFVMRVAVPVVEAARAVEMESPPPVYGMVPLGVGIGSAPVGVPVWPWLTQESRRA